MDYALTSTPTASIPKSLRNTSKSDGNTSPAPPAAMCGSDLATYRSDQRRLMGKAPQKLGFQQACHFKGTDIRVYIDQLVSRHFGIHNGSHLAVKDALANLRHDTPGKIPLRLVRKING